MTTEESASPTSAEKRGNDIGDYPAPKQPSASTMARYWQLLTILLPIVAVAGTYIGNNMAVAKAKAEMTQKAEQVIGEQNRLYLRLVMIPLGWAVGSEMIRDNYGQKNQYLAQFVREQNIKEIVVARPDGKVVAATNKKLEGGNLASSFPGEVLQSESTTISTRGNGELVAVSPVMGLNTKLGVLVLVYAPVAFGLDNPVPKP